MSFKLPRTNGVLHIPTPTGKHTVGCVDVFSTESNGKLPLLYRLYYPTKSSPDTSRWPSWLPHPRYADGYSSSTLPVPLFVLPTVGRLFSWLSGNPGIPANEGATPSTEKFPVIIFSHGLIACRTSYSTLCTDMASKGYYVAALEHGDKSACARMLLTSPDAEPEWLDREVLPRGAPEDELRERQLEYRTREVSQCLDSLTDLNSGLTQEYFIRYSSATNTYNNNIGLDAFKGKIDVDSAVISGHSMGGATTVRSLSKESRFKGGVALDSWMFPVRKDEAQFDKSKLLFLNFEKWQGEKNLKTMSRFEANLKIGEVDSNVVTLKDAIHYACTDILLIFQESRIGSYFLSRARGDPYERVLTNSELFSGWVQRSLHGETQAFIEACEKRKKDIFFGLEKS